MYIHFQYDLNCVASHNVEFKSKPGASPELFLLDEDEQPVEVSATKVNVAHITNLHLLIILNY